MRKNMKQSISSILAVSMLAMNMTTGALPVGAAGDSGQTAEEYANEQFVTTAYAASSFTVLAGDAVTAHPYGIGGNGSADMPEEVEIGTGVYAINGGSSFSEKNNSYIFADGSIYDTEFQVGKGNASFLSDMNVGDKVQLPIEKGLKVSTESKAKVSLYTGIGSSGVKSIDFLVADEDGKIVAKTAVVKDDSTGVFSIGEAVLPTAGDYYIFNPQKQASWNFAALKINYEEEEPTTEASTETTTAAEIINMKASVSGGSDVISASEIGKTVNIDFSVENNPGFNNYTLFVKYDPSVIRAKEVNKTNSDEVYLNAYDAKVFNTQITGVPLSYDVDYSDVGADGVKTQAELGKIKYAWKYDVYDKNNNLLEINGDGILFSLTFDVIGEGDAKLEVVGTRPFNHTPAKRSSTSIGFSFLPNNISVGGGAESDTPTETTTAFGTLSMKASVSGGSDTISTDKIGKTVNIDFSVKNNPGFNNYTFFIKYNPSVIKAKEVNKTISDGVYLNAYDAKVLNAQIAGVPRADDPDYSDVGADGVKTQAELGKIKYAWRYDAHDENYNLLEINGDGILFSLTFDVIGVGDAKIEIVGTEPFHHTPVNLTDDIGFIFQNSNIIVSGDAKTETTTETTTISGSLSVKASVSGGSDTISADKIGQSVNVDFNVTNNPGFNNYTFFIKYNPAVLKAVSLNKPASYDEYITGAGNKPAYSDKTVNEQIALVPLVSDPDYADVAADGVKTAAELGKIKIAYVYNEKDENNNLLELNGDGILLSLTFEVIGEGDADIKAVGFDPFNPSPVNTDKVIEFTSLSSDIKVVRNNMTTEITTETTTETTTTTIWTTESTTKATTETTTETTTSGDAVPSGSSVSTETESSTETTTETTTSSDAVPSGSGVSTETESSTETTTETTTSSDAVPSGSGVSTETESSTESTTDAPSETHTEVPYGAAGGGKTISSADSAFILQKVLTSSYTMPIERITDNYFFYLDVNVDGQLTAADSAIVLQKVLNSSYKMPIELK